MTYFKSLTPVALASGVLMLSTSAHSRRADTLSPRVAGPAPYTESIANTKVVFDMVPIPAGSFTMGSPPNEAGRGDDEGPAHEVMLKAFYIGTKEVTWDEYDEFAFSQDLLRKRKLGVTTPPDAADAMTRPTPPYADESWGWGKEKQPVIGITQYAAAHYCQWLSARTGRHYRLPTEAEWEYAARAGTKTAYWFGDDASKLATYAWLRGNAGEQPHVGGQKPANAWGLFDVHGNVAEWTADKYDAAYYAASPKADPFNDPGKALYPHAVRGGSWDDDAPRLRSAARRGSMEAWSRRDPQNPKSLWWHTDATFVGFRVVAEMDNSGR
jgi:formylglycine-generating enzyme required for sulfatase activity